jgi:O-succinylbenzoate synthase
VGLVAGGLLEAGLGRRVLAAVAALPGFTATGDCSPAGRWLADDPWPPEVVAGTSIALHHGPGLAPPPRIDVLDGLTRQRAEVRR